MYLMLSTNVTHYGDFLYAAKLDTRADGPAEPILALVVVALCQAVLCHRSCAFSKALAGRLSTLRWVLSSAIGALAVASCVLGVRSFLLLAEYQRSEQAALAGQAADSSRPAWEVMIAFQATWLATSLLVDV